MKRVLKSVLCGVALMVGFSGAGCGSTPQNRSTGEVIDDTAILAKVKAALVNDPVISARSIKVDVYRGEVTLSGAVNSEVEKKKAEDIVVGVDGVRTVEDKLVVRQ
jgi:hyperosmotically inducible periplasmic protein